MAVLLMINMICFQAVRAASEGLYAEAEIVDNNVMITGGGCLSTIRNAAVKICNPAGETVHLNQIDVNDDGTFAYMTALGENDGSGHYSITVMARGAKQPFVTDVYYLSGKEAEKIENGINAAASAKEAEALIRTEAEVLGIGGFTDQQVSVAAEMLYHAASVKTLTFSEIQAIARKSEALFAQLQTVSANGLGSLLTGEHDVLLGTCDAYGQYQRMKSKDRNAVNEAVVAKKPFGSVTDFKEKFEQAVSDRSGMIEKRRIDAAVQKNGDSIVISGKSGLSASGAVTVKLCDPTGRIVNLNQIKENADGGFAYAVVMAQTAETGTYTAEVFGRGADEKTTCTVFYLSNQMRDSIEREINQAASAAAEKAVLQKYAKEMELTALSEDEFVNTALWLYEQKPAAGWKYAEVSEIVTKAQDLIGKLNLKDWTDADEYITANKDVLLHGVSAYSVYAAKDETQRNSICKIVMQSVPFLTIQSFRTAFAVAVPMDGSSQTPTGPTGGGGGGGGSLGSGSSNSFPAAVEVKPSEPETESRPFIDLADYAWAEEYIHDLYKAAVISPAADQRFRPGDSITREEFVKLVVGALNIQNSGAMCSFSDVGESDWYYPYVASACAAGIIRGYEDNSFGTGRKITRQEIAAILYRAAQACGIEMKAAGDGNGFLDGADIDDYAKDAVAALQAAGIINGDENGTFRPHDNAVRAEAAKMIAVMAKNVKQS